MPAGPARLRSRVGPHLPRPPADAAGRCADSPSPRVAARAARGAAPRATSAKAACLAGCSKAAASAAPARRARGSPEYVRKRVALGRLTRKIARRRQRAVREQIAIGGAVRQLEPLTLPKDVDCVVTDHVTAAQSVDSHLFVGTRAHVTAATVNFTQLAAGGARGLGQALGRARRRV